ncbi:MAG: general secretion pathway protein GspK [Elusimicrobia bacterium]|nr:general secretion pathway protein GspK [Elusimicrobiota bacterium]
MERVTTRSSQGSILMVVLWLMGILALVASAFSFHARTERRLTVFQWDQIQQAQVAKKKSAQAAALVENSSAPLTLGDLSLWDALIFPDKAEPTSPFLSDESSRINVNFATKETLERLTGYRDVAASILDWRDSDSLVTAGGAETDFYETLAEPYPCRNGPLQSVPELLLLKGMTAELYEKISPLVTVEGPGTVNVHTAPAEVLEALGASTALVNKILVYRKGADLLAGTSDDGVFPKKSQVIELLEKRWPLNESEKDSWQKVEDRISLRGSALRLDFPVTVENSLSTRWYQIGVDPTDGGQRIQSWHEGTAWGKR